MILALVNGIWGWHQMILALVYGIWGWHQRNKKIIIVSVIFALLKLANIMFTTILTRRLNTMLYIINCIISVAFIIIVVVTIRKFMVAIFGLMQVLYIMIDVVSSIGKMVGRAYNLNLFINENYVIFLVVGNIISLAFIIVVAVISIGKAQHTIRPNCNSEKICTKCGLPISEGKKFCTNCGTPIK